MKPFILIIFLLLVSCTKSENKNCVVCRITYIMTTDVPVEGYPSTSTVEVELCNQTTEQIKQFEETNKGSEAAVIGGVTYSSSYSTKCDY